MALAYKWHGEKSIYHQLFIKLLKSNARPQAMQFLKLNSKMFMPYEEFEKHLKDEDLYDEDLHSYFTTVFISTD